MVLGMASMASMALLVVEAARLLSSPNGVMTSEESLRRFGMLSVAHEYHPNRVEESKQITAIADSTRDLPDADCPALCRPSKPTLHVFIRVSGPDFTWLQLVSFCFRAERKDGGDRRRVTAPKGMRLVP